MVGYTVSGATTIIRGSNDVDAAVEFGIQLSSLTGFSEFVFYP